MAKAELTVARTKRGECVTCGRKCYRKKLFKMIPLDEPGKVLNGRCLNCKPLQSKDVSIVSSSNSSPHMVGRNPSSRGNRSINDRKSVNEKDENNGPLSFQKKKNSSHHLWKFNTSQKQVVNDGKEPSTHGKQPSPLGRTNSNPFSAARNRYNRSHSTLSRSTVDTAITTRPSIVSISTNAARKNAVGISTLSMGSASSIKRTAKSDTKGRRQSTSGRSLVFADSFGSSICEKRATKSSEISWTPPPNHLEFGNSDDEREDLDNNHKSKFNSRVPLRKNSVKSVKSTASRHSPPTREEFEQAALTLMAARHHGLTGVDGPLYEDMFDELGSSEQIRYSRRNSRNRGMRTDSPRKFDSFHTVDSVAEKSDRIQDFHREKYAKDYAMDAGTKLKSDASLNGSFIESVQNPDVKRKQSSSTSNNEDQDEDLEQNSSIAESNICSPKMESTSHDDVQVSASHSNQHFRNQPRQGVLNRGGAFQPRNTNYQGRPGPGTQVFTGSIGTMSSMSSIGEDDRLLRQNSSEQKKANTSQRRQIFSRIPSFSRYHQGSCRTLGSLSTIEVINEEEDTKIRSSLEDSFPDVLSVDHHNSTPSVASSIQSVAKGNQESANKCNMKKPPNYERDDRLSLDRTMETCNLTKKVDLAPTEYDEELDSDDNIAYNDFVNHDDSALAKQDEDDNVHFNNNCIAFNGFEEQLTFLRKSSESSDQIRAALEILSESKTLEDIEGKESLPVIEAMLASMQSHAASYDVQLWGFRAIHKLSSSTTFIQNAFVEAGATTVITKAMKQFIDMGEDLQEKAITLLSNFAINESNIDNLLHKGTDAVESIIAAMEKYPANAGLQTKGCEAFAILASHNDSTLRRRIMDNGAGEAILFNAVEMHSEDHIVQRAALLAVRNLSTDCEENQNRFLELGVIDPILSAMNKHRSAAELQETGAGALSIIAGNNIDTRKVIEENEGIKLILRAILDHSNVSAENETYTRTLLTLSLGSYNSNDTESRASEGNIKAAAATSAVIDAIAAPTEKDKPSKLALAINAVIIAMEAHENVSAVQEVGCVILGGLAEVVAEGIADDSNQTKMDIVDEGALDVINMAMVLHKHEGRVQERACGLLWALSIEENYASIIAAIGIQLLEDAADNFPGRCRDLANRLIERLVEDDRNINEE